MSEIEETKYIPYQKCPICEGKGLVIPIYDTSSLYEQCDVCLGKKIIPMHEIREASNE